MKGIERQHMLKVIHTNKRQFNREDIAGNIENITHLAKSCVPKN